MPILCLISKLFSCFTEHTTEQQSGNCAMQNLFASERVFVENYAVIGTIDISINTYYLQPKLFGRFQERQISGTLRNPIEGISC